MTTKDWRKALISPQKSIRQAIQTIDVSAMQIALVVNEQKQLLGTVTDGDIRRGLLKGCSLDDPVSSIMNERPTRVSTEATNEQILALMKQKSLHQIPVVDREEIVLDLVSISSFLEPPKKDNWVVLMAGGLGTRLSPLTNDCPKPLLKVGGKPILENILNSFLEYGFYNFFISVNYKSQMIEEYFGNGSRWGINIHYLRESQKLGTAGSLSLLPAVPQEPFFVMNGDLLTKVNFLNMLSYHEEQDSVATMAVREYEFQVPFGVIHSQEKQISSIIEKPVYKFNVNAGIYLLNPLSLRNIPSKKYYDMPELFKSLIQQEEKTVVFPIWEYWLDIGQLNDFQKAQKEFHNIFE